MLWREEKAAAKAPWELRGMGGMGLCLGAQGCRAGLGDGGTRMAQGKVGHLQERGSIAVSHKHCSLEEQGDIK